MGARLGVEFYADKESEKPEAIIYDHWGGDNPTDARATLDQFFETVETQTRDTRFNDASYLAAKFVVYRALKYANSPLGNRPLDFLGVGIIPSTEGYDVAQLARVYCDEPGRPLIVMGEAR